MAMTPVLTALLPPFIRGGAAQVVGSGFGRVSSVCIVNESTLSQTECEFQIDTGESIHFTVPLGALDGTYHVLLGTLDGTTSTNNAGVFNLPDDSFVPPAPGDWTLQNPIPAFSGPAYDAILARARLEAGDFKEAFSTSAAADGVTRTFDLPVEVVSSDGLIVALADTSGVTALAENTDYTLDYELGLLTLEIAPAAGKTVQVIGSNYQFFTDDEWNVFILSAAEKHTHNMNDETAYRSVNGYKQYTVTQQTIDTLPPVEYHPLALKAAIEALWVIATDAGFDINVTTAEGTSLPRAERFQNVLALIQAKDAQYTKLCQQLNVGLDRIEVFTLRRVSRTTGRLVPVYRDREYDDYSLPDRVYVHIDSGKTANDTDAPDPYFGGGGVYP